MAYYLISLIFILGFTKGTLELIGLDQATSQMFIDISIMILFLYALLYMARSKLLKGPALSIQLALFLVILSSFIFNDVTEIQMLLFLRKFGTYYLFFYALFNLGLTTFEKERIFKLLIFLFLVQIPAAFIKLMNVGTMEDYQGMMSIQEGSLATTMPLMAITYLIANYLEYKKVKSLLLILLFISIGLISNKMGILYYVMILFIFLTFLYSKRHQDSMLKNTSFTREMLISSVILLFIFAAFVSLNPRANPENKVGGSVDIGYLIEWTERYQTFRFKGSRIEGDGRFQAPGVVFDRLASAGPINLLFGFGPGDIVKSAYTEYENPLAQKYRIGYGGRIGLVWVLMQIGFIGLIVFLLFNLILLKKLWVVYFYERRSQRSQILALSTLGLSFIYFLDFFTYSSGMLHNPGLAASYYFAIYYVLSEEDERSSES